MNKEKKKMKAARYEQFGDPEKNVKIDTVEIPELKEGEVLVKVKAAGVNPVDAIIQSGAYKDKMPHSLPVIPGWDLAGIVEERGFSARRFEKGEAVYAYVRRPEIKWGTFAEYIVAPESYLTRKPQTLCWEDSAAIPLAGLTAYQALFSSGKLSKGEKVLIIGASGGVGSFAIQLAKHKGAEVTGVASKENHEYMKELGAKHTIDYKNNDLGKAAKEHWKSGADLIFDCVGGDSLEQAIKALKPGGKIVSIKSRGEDLDDALDFEFVFVEPNSSQLNQLRELADRGTLKVNVTKIYSIEETAEALKEISNLHTTGKMVIVP